jgi:hypothetical protein
VADRRVTNRMYRFANVLRKIRCSGQFTTLTPFRYRDPMTTSAVAAAAVSAGR